MFSTRWATKSYFLLNCWQNQLQTAATVGKFGQVAIGKDFPKWRNESSQIVSYRSCCQQQLFKAHQLYIHHWNSVSLTWLRNHASCTASFAFFFASAHQTRCSNCNLGVSKHCASSRKRGATPLSSTLAMGGFCSMPRSNNAGLGKPAINCMVNNLNYITPACIYLSKSVTVLCLGQDFGAMELLFP